MRKCAAIVCALLVLSMLAGCLKDEVGGVRITSDAQFEVYSVPRQVASTLFHAGGPWTATSNASWLKVVKESGAGGTDTLAVVTVEKNLTGSERMAQVTLESGGQRVMVDVRQSGEYAVFDEKEYVMPATGGLLDVTFHTNVADSLMLYVTGYLSEFLEDTRKKDSASAENTTRADDAQGRLDWLKVKPNVTDTARFGMFFLSINTKSGRRVDLDTLVFMQLPAGVSIQSAQSRK